MDKDFQLRYSLVVVYGTIIGLILILTPIFFLMNQNYELFIKLAYDNAPQMVDYLEGERTLMRSVLLGFALSASAFFFILGIKMTARIVGPITVLKNHLNLLSRGHWFSQKIKVREQDEFQEVIDAYNYFLSTFTMNLKRELEYLEKIKLEKKLEKSQAMLQRLINEKRSQLGLNTDDEEKVTSGDASPSAVLDSRRVS